MGLRQRIESLSWELPAQQKRVFSAAFYILVTLATLALSIFVAEFAKNTFSDWGWSFSVQSFSIGVIIAITLYLLVTAFRKFYDKPIISNLKTHTDKFDLAASRLIVTLGSDDDSSEGFLVDIGKIVNSHRTQKNIGEIALLESGFDNLQKAFVRETRIAEKDTGTKTLRIIGTMLGTYGSNGLGLASELAELFISRKGFRQPPFINAYLGVPGFIADDSADVELYKDVNEGEELYPFSARITACNVLSSICENLGCDLHSEVGPILRFNIRFLPQRDLFPAIQLWDEDFGMILCSTGFQDRMSASSVPVAVLLKKSVELFKGTAFQREHKLEETLRRLKGHLKNDYGLKWPSSRTETWELNTVSRTIVVRNYHRLCERVTLLNRVKLDPRIAGLSPSLDEFFSFTEGDTPRRVVDLSETFEDVGVILQTLSIPISE